MDYEKAFNRMKHDECINQLRRLGASPGSISLVRAFLEGRAMTICIEDHKPSPIPITSGSPKVVSYTESPLNSLHKGYE